MDEIAKIYARFCRETLAAIDAEDKPDWFNPECGLCCNLSDWLYREIMLGNIVWDAAGGVNGHQDNLLKEEAYPFNKDLAEYHNEDKYKNPLRLAHLLEHAKDL